MNVIGIWNGAWCNYCNRKQCTSCAVAQREELERQENNTRRHAMMTKEDLEEFIEDLI